MNWGDIFNQLMPLLMGGGIVVWVTLKDKKKQEGEKTAQAHEQTRQDQVETDIKQFEYLTKRIEFAEQHIVTLHKKMTGMQQTINEYVSRTIYAESHICEDESCQNRQPALGTFKPKCKKVKKEVENGENGV